MAIGSLAGAGTLGLLIPPSIIMIVYGVTADVSIAQLFIAGVIPGIAAGAASSRATSAPGRSLNADKIPPPDAPMTFAQKLHESRNLIPVVLLIARGARLDLHAASRPRPKRPRSASSARWCSRRLQGSLNWRRFTRIADGRARASTA